jgi:hypothetical protein
MALPYNFGYRGHESTADAADDATAQRLPGAVHILRDRVASEGGCRHCRSVEMRTLGWSMNLAVVGLKGYP